MKARVLKSLRKNSHAYTNTGAHTQNHVLILSSHFICLNIFNKHVFSLPGLTPDSSKAQPPKALQQHLISILCAVYTLHALVELIEVSPAHHSEMGAMCCAVCQPVFHI